MLLSFLFLWCFEKLLVVFGLFFLKVSLSLILAILLLCLCFQDVFLFCSWSFVVSVPCVCFIALVYIFSPGRNESVRNRNLHPILFVYWLSESKYCLQLFRACKLWMFVSVFLFFLIVLSFLEIYWVGGRPCLFLHFCMKIFRKVWFVILSLFVILVLCNFREFGYELI